jgi:uncharacterized protein YjeT (DUF2065 family)
MGHPAMLEGPPLIIKKDGSSSYAGKGFWNTIMEFFLCVLGMVMIVEGLPYFAAPEKMKYWVQKVVATPDSSLRRLGLVLMSIGLLLVYFGRT